MNNIKILEELINDYRNCGLDDFPESLLDFGLNKSQIIAIKNLIQENKELKEKIKGLECENEIKIGEWVRTDNGIIGKYVKYRELKIQ